MTSSRDGVAWSPFAPISLGGYKPAQGDIYFFSAQTNPVHPASLLALMPLTHFLSGCIAISCSHDGLRWASVTPLAGCEVYGERASHHPVAGLVRHGDSVHLYVHENVPGITADKVTPRMLSRYPSLRQPPPLISRRTIRADALLRWTVSCLARVPAEGGPA